METPALASLDESAPENMERNGACMTGEISADVKAEILRLVIQTRDQRDSDLAARMEAAETAMRNHRDAKAGLP